MFMTVMMVSLSLPHHGFAVSGPVTAGPPEGKGSWVGALSAYTTEHLAEEKGGKGWAYRKKQLLRYEASVPAGKEVSVREYGGTMDAASLAIGRDKAGMVFHLLRRMSGDEVFFRVAKTLVSEAPSRSWDDIKALFEKELGQDLGWFFKQWVDRKGLPGLSVENAAAIRNGSRFEVRFDLVQKGDVYTLDIPVSISFLRGGSKADRVTIDAERKHVVLVMDDEPSALVIDQDYDVPRRITAAETPPLLAKLLGDERMVLVLPASAAEIYAGALDAWKQRGAVEKQAGDLKDGDIKAASLLVFGADNPLIGRLYGKVEIANEALSLVARKNPWNQDKVVVLAQAKSAAVMTGSLRSISEYGESSSLSIDVQGQKRQTRADSERGIGMELRAEAAAIDVSALKTMTEVIEKASGKRVVFVGEYHDRFAHHNVQLQVIKHLYRKDPKIAIGMEMFQRPFQKALDEYISGAINEREFLKQAQYFKRWSFDYNLYKPILDFARTEKIPVVALNLRREITDKVSKGGMDSLTDDEKKEIPAQLDFSDSSYRERLKQAFDQHKTRGERSFDFFYQAQVLWDETMALSIDEYLQRTPDRRMVVLAGLGHLAYGSGIPKRVLRRNAYEVATILNDGDVEQDICDYLVFPQPLEGVLAPKIMAALKEASNGVSIVDLPEESVSRKAGIKVGDTLIAFDGALIKDVDDIKIALFYKKSGDTATLRVVRKRFLLGDKEIEFVVTFP